jgi:hypothetical protein
LLRKRLGYSGVQRLVARGALGAHDEPDGGSVTASRAMVGFAIARRPRQRHRIGFKVVEKANARGSVGERTPSFSFGGAEGGTVYP